MSDETPQLNRPRRIRWPVAIGIVVASGLLLGVLQLPDVFSNDAHRNLATIAAALLTGGALLFWAVFLTGFSAAARMRLMLACAAVAVAVISLVRIDEVSGNLVPSFAWRWTAKPDETLTQQTRQSDVSAGAGTVNLAETSDHDFPQFLGKTRDARVTGLRLARDWQKRPPRELWRQPIGAGWSGFAVVGDFAVTQEQRGPDEMITCYELATGLPRWSHADETRFSSIMGGDGPRATPTIDRGRVYAVGASGDFVCLDGATGELLWRHDLLTQHQAKLPEWGISRSPLIVGDRVVVSAGGPNGHSLVAYDCETGDLVWHAGNQPSSYASPIFATLLDTPQILMVNQQQLAAHAPDDGHLLWQFPWPGGEPKVPDPIPIGSDRVLIAAGYGLGCKLLQLDRANEVEVEVKLIWENRLLKPKFTNIVVRDDAIYGLDDGRTLVCLNLTDGKLRWRGGRYGHGQLLLADDLLLVQSEAGEIALVEATPKRFHELTRFTALGGKTWNTPALAGRYLLVRNAAEAACYELPVEEVQRAIE
ncbi:MAG TPA: PQQ-binding-like beta-propeller repeat protein [Pirellulales bacterium]|nr:PQQ-binding-like beta-propeller repeat protein [Pirellulales bacterium]